MQNSVVDACFNIMEHEGDWIFIYLTNSKLDRLLHHWLCCVQIYTLFDLYDTSCSFSRGMN